MAPVTAEVDPQAVVDYECIWTSDGPVVPGAGLGTVEATCDGTYPYVYGGGCGTSYQGNRLVGAYPSAVAQLYRCDYYVEEGTITAIAMCCK